MSTLITQPLKEPKRAVVSKKVSPVRVKTGAGSKSSYARKEYGVTESELRAYAKRVHVEIEEAHKAGTLREFTGDIEALCEGHGDAPVAK